MRCVILIVTLLFINEKTSLIINFQNNDAQNWYVVNDVVMGGRSTGEISTSKKSIRFTGMLSLENNGGFASIRSLYKNYNFSDYSKVKIKYKSKNKQFAFLLELSEQWYKPYYKFYLDNTLGKWQVIEIDLKAFEGYQIGKPTGNLLLQEQLSKILRLGFMTTEKQPGPFEFEVDYIEFTVK